MLEQRMSTASTVYVLWLVTIALQLLLAGVFLYRKSWLTYPIFTAYLFSSLIHSLALLAFKENRHIYFYLYWVGEAVAIILGFLVLFEVFKHIFRHHSALYRLASLIFTGSLLVLIGVAVFILIHAGPQLTGNVGRSVMVFEEATRTIEVGLLIVLFMCTGAFGLHWRQSVFGIALGLGIFVSVELIAVTMRSQASLAMHNVFSIVRASAYTISLLVWGGYMLLPEQAADESELPQRGQLEQWNQAVMELIHQ